MDTPQIILLVSVFALVTGALLFFFNEQRKAKKEENKKIQNSLQMQLQAYERLVLLVDRIALSNLISRLSQSDLSAREMQLLLTRTIREEFDYNITQQIYISPDAWNAIKNLKEQNILIINQAANTLPTGATATDLNKLLLEFCVHDRKGSLHEVVSEVLSFEAKKLLQQPVA